MNTKTTVGVIVLILGLVIVNYGYLHDLIWQGADVIIMGLRSYVIVLLGTVASLIGVILVTNPR